MVASWNVLGMGTWAHRNAAFILGLHRLQGVVVDRSGGAARRVAQSGARPWPLRAPIRVRAHGWQSLQALPGDRKAVVNTLLKFG